MDYDDPENEDEKEDTNSDDSDNEFDLAKVKMEVDDTMDVSKLEQLVEEQANADMHQLKELEEKEDQDIENLKNDDDIYKLLSKKASVTCSSILVKEFTSDTKKHMWCKVKFEVPIKFKNVDLTSVIRDAARTAVIWEIPKIKRAITFKQNDLLCIKTEGINIEVKKITLAAHFFKFLYIIFSSTISGNAAI